MTPQHDGHRGMQVAKDRRGWRLGVTDMLWRAVATGVASVLLAVVGAAMAEAVGLPPPNLGGEVDPSQTRFDTFLSGALIGSTIGPLVVRLPLPTAHRAALAFTVLYGIGSVVSGLEIIFFTTITFPQLAHFLLSTAVSCAGMAVLLAYLFQPESRGETIGRAWRTMAASRPAMSLGWRFALAGLSYLPLFFVFGLLVYPLVQGYYEDPALGMVVPGAGVILAVEIARGFLMVVAVVPLIAVMGHHLTRWAQTQWIALALVVPGAWLPMLAAGHLPEPMRLLHGLENTLSFALFGILIVRLLGFDGDRWEQAAGRDVNLQSAGG